MKTRSFTGGNTKISFEERRSSMMTTLKQFAKNHLQFLVDIRFPNGCGQACCGIGLVGIAGWVVGVAIPLLYSEEGHTGTLMKVVVCFVVIQLIVNWFFIKTVDSSYSPSKHGVKPDHIGMGENVNAARDEADFLNRNGHKEDVHNKRRKDATSLKMNTGSLMYVATEYPSSADTKPKRKAFPYFSWTPCLRCNRLRPPRCHHCPSCEKCVLKRVHHCSVSGVCVGYHNLRHFVVFLTWASVATIFATLHAGTYIYYDFYDVISIVDLFFPIAFIRCLLGYISLKHTLLITLIWLLLVFLVLSTTLLRSVFVIVTTGLTSLEQDSKFVMYDTRAMNGKLEAVFGKFWWLNFLLPLHFVFKPMDDPVNWPSIRA